MSNSTDGNLTHGTLTHILEPPRYGFEKEGKLCVPTARELWREFFHRLNVFASVKYWLPATGWFFTCALGGVFVWFVAFHFSFPLLLVGMVYSMVALGTHGTVFLHRYSTHRAFTFRNRFSLFIVRNLVIKIIPEEIYVISHHVHHQISEKPGDPYNVNGGWLYCFLADVNHQLINTRLSEPEYKRLTRLMSHTGVKVNDYGQYQRYGSLAHPLRTVLHYLLNWAFWFAAFTLLGGISLAIAIFGCAAIWAFGVRTYNYDGHGRGKDRRQEGVDFNRRDLSVNQIWPGYVAGEWHNNHHLYPSGARSGFLPYQLDLAWQFIRLCHWLGAVSTYRDYKADFYAKYYRPYQEAQVAAAALVAEPIEAK